ncbi:MAG: hypothetical protein ACJAS9_000584 [Polaribacter sp.]|jgi:hypothetical protein
MQEKANELKQGSDELTRYARLYVTTKKLNTKIPTLIFLP